MRTQNSDLRYSMRLRLLIFVLLVWFVPVFLLSSFISRLLPRMTEMAENSLLAGADYAWAQVLGAVDSAVTLSRDATYDGELAAAYDQHAQGLLSDTELVRLSRNYLERKYSREGLVLCSIYIPDDRSGLVLSPRADADRVTYYLENVHAAAMEVRESLDTRCRFVQLGGRTWLLRALLGTNMQPYGMLVLEIDYDRLTAPLTAVAEQWDAEQVIQLDEIGADSLNWAELPAGLDDTDREHLGYTRFSDSRDWTLNWHLNLPGERIFGQVRQFRRLLLGLYLLLVVVLILFALYVYRRFSKPVSVLIDAANRIEAGEFGVVVPMRGRDEIGTLGRAFSSMSVRLKELIDRNYREEIALRDARIQALQSRINPHFINNALEDINWQARIDGSENVSRMVSALSVLLNATMANRDRRTVPLREELSVVDAYVFFIQERYGDRLSLERDVDETLLDTLLPLLTLQPVLENAVEHGIAPAGSGAISIRIFREAEMMCVEIGNTGRPLSPEDQERMNAALAGSLEGNHVGLSNIAGRLRLIYHEKAEMSASWEDGWTLVRMRIPIETEEEKP